MATYKWNASNWACIATWTILESNDLLDQFEAFLLPIGKAGDVKLMSLPYAQHNLSQTDLEGRADQMARKFFYYVVLLYTGRKENSQTTLLKIHQTVRAQFASQDTTFTSLAEVIDGFLKGKSE